MAKKKGTACILFLMIFFIFSAFPVYADLFWQNIQETKGMRGQPDEVQTVDHYFTENASRTEIENMATIMDFDSMTLYQLDMDAKTFHKVDLNSMGHMAGEEGQDSEAFSKMMKQMMGETKVIPTNETRKIAGYDCRKYNMQVMMVQIEYWVTKDIEHYKELKEIGEKMAEGFEKNPMMQHLNFAAHMKQMDGFPVQTITQNPMGGTIVSTLKHIEKKKLSDDLFQVPPDYKLTESEMFHQ
jgi:hypothetical protein